MDQIYRRPAQQRELRVLNQREDRDLQHKLNMLDKQHRFTCKMLQQRQESLMNKQRRVVMVKVCEPKATVNIAMREIGEHKNTEAHFRGIHTSDGRRLDSSKPQHHNTGSEQAEQSRSVSAPPPSVKPVRRRGNIQSNVSLMQMKNIATIDSISEKEVARQRREAREETERLKQLQTETLHKRVTAFIQRLKEKGNVEKHAEPP